VLSKLPTFDNAAGCGGDCKLSDDDAGVEEYMHVHKGVCILVYKTFLGV
jgi:hypothetical protein